MINFCGEELEQTKNKYDDYLLVRGNNEIVCIHANECDRTTYILNN
jgi:hypothetical protein